jgi:fructose-1,6-bisphosphatase I
MTDTKLRRYLKKCGVDHKLILLLEDVASSCRSVASSVRKGAFDGTLGSAHSVNIQGEGQKTLDILANDAFERICGGNAELAALISEEVEQVTWLKEPKKNDFLLYFDPLDGSSNIDVNMSVGSIFSVMQVETDGDRNVLFKGRRQICAGYALYGPSTMLVLTVGDDVSGFTFEDRSGEFILTHPNMKVPHETSEFSINTSRYRYWDDAIKRYIDECVAGEDGVRKRYFNMRWTASMVAEIHRILTRGGVFIYPADSNNRAVGGKLRLLYEANPMAMLIEQAGGLATTGLTEILEILPMDHHQRVPVIMGSCDEVKRLCNYHLA